MKLESAADVVFPIRVILILFRQSCSPFARRENVGSSCAEAAVSPSNSPFGSFKMRRGLAENSGYQQSESAAAAQYKLHQALKLINDLERRSEEANDEMESYKMRLADAELRARTLELQYKQQAKNKSMPNFESSDLLVMPRITSRTSDMPQRSHRSLPHLDEISVTSTPVASRTAGRQRRQSLPPLEMSSLSATTNQHPLSSPAYCKYRRSMDSKEKTAPQPFPNLSDDECFDVEVARQILGYKQLSHGEFHPATASAKRSLADALRLQGNLDEAERLYHSALKILGVVYGGEGPESDRIRSALNKMHLSTDSLPDEYSGQRVSETGLENQKASVCSDKNDVGHKIGTWRRKVLTHGENDCATAALAKFELPDILRNDRTIKSEHLSFSSAAWTHKTRRLPAS